MKNEQTLEQKVQELLKLDKEIKKIENDRDSKVDQARERLLGDFSDFDEELEFISQEEYIKEKCGEDPLKKISKRYKCPPEKPNTPIGAILGGLACLIGIILTISGFINSWSKNSDTPFFQGLLAIAGVVQKT